MNSGTSSLQWEARFGASRRISKAWLAASGFSALVLAAASAWANAPRVIELKSSRTHSRLAVRMDAGQTYEFKETPQGFSLRIKGIGLSDLGAPLGEERRFAEQYERLQDQRLRSLRLRETADGVEIAGVWRFASGANAPAHPKMEAFEYFEKDPSRWVVDFWSLGGPTVAEFKAQQLRQQRVATLHKEEVIRKTRATRQLASERTRKEIEDVTLYCRQPLNEQNSVFLKLKPFHEKVDFSRWIPSTTADSAFAYFEPRSKDRAAQYQRLALRFYREGKFALVLRTLDFYIKEIPASQREAAEAEMTFLRANTLLKLGFKDEATEVFNDIKRSHRGSIVALHSAAFLAGREIATGSPLTALGHFQWLITEYPKHETAWIFHLGAAESLFRLRETERAQKEYQWVTENAPTPADRAEAALRAGDVFSDRFAYEQALASYFQGIRYFGDQATVFAPVHINRAEALYQLGQYPEAQKAFEAFLKEFPSHPAGWRAAYRLGEIAGRREGAPALTESRRWFTETINRFPISAGAVLARIRLIPCGDHAGLDSAAQERFFRTEAQDFDGGGEVVMSNYSDYKSLAHVRALINYGRESETVNVAIENIRSAKSPQIRQVLGSVLVSYFRKTLMTLLADGKRYEALTFYQEKAERIPKDLPPTDPDYLLRLSQAAADLGFGKLAGDLVAAYQKEMAPKPTAEGRKIASAFAPVTELETKTQSAEVAFTRAKARWIADGVASAKQVREWLLSVPEDTAFSFEREIMLGLIEEHAGNVALAVSHAQRALLLARQSSPMDGEPRLEAWLGGLEARGGSPKTAVEILREVEKRMSLREAASKEAARVPAARSESMESAAALGVPPVPGVELLILQQAELHEKLGQWGAAAQAYGRAREQGLGGNRAGFGYARSILKSGDGTERAQAFRALEQVAQSKTDDFWKKLAIETLANEKSVVETSGESQAKPEDRQSADQGGSK